MKFFKLYFVICMFVFNIARAVDDKNYLSSLPPELIQIIIKDLDIKSMTNLKKMDKNLYNKIDNYLDEKINSSHLTLDGTFDELNDWLKFLASQNSENKQENTKIKNLVLNLNENASFYFNQSNINFKKYDLFIRNIAKKLPNLSNLTINKYIDKVLFSHSEVMISKNWIHLAGNDVNINTLIREFCNHRKLDDVNTVIFELLKSPYSFNFNMWLEGLSIGVGLYIPNVNTVYLVDVDNYYFAEKTLFDREEVLKNIISLNKIRNNLPLIKDFKVIRNGIEEVYNFD